MRIKFYLTMLFTLVFLMPSSYAATIISVGGTLSSNQTICPGFEPSALTLTGNTGNVLYWQRDTNPSFTSATTIASTATILSGSSVGSLTTTTYLRAVVQDGTSPIAYSSTVTITVSALSDSSCGAFITRWNLATAGTNATTLSVGTATSGTATYYWQEVGGGAASGSGSFSGTTLTITGLPTGATIRLGIYPINFQRIVINNGTDKSRLLDVEQWGTTVWTSTQFAFKGCNNLNITATDIPVLTSCNNMEGMFESCNTLNGPTNINSWNTAAVVNMTGVFRYATAFNQNIGSWNTASVNGMNYMFNSATAFNQNIGSWNTAAVTGFTNMFNAATAFNQNIGSWNTALVTEMSGMFNGAASFNQNIGSWNTGAVVSMFTMFQGATSFNQNLGNWNLNANVNLIGMLSSSGIDCSNYAATLVGWQGNPSCPTGRTFGAEWRTYGSAATAARANLVLATGSGGKGWTISDGGVSVITISSQSTATQNSCINVAFSPITVTATGVGLTYQWYSNTTASTTGGTSLAAANGAQTNSYTPQSTVAGTLYYYCIVSGTCGAAVTSAISGAFITNTVAISSQNTPPRTRCINVAFTAITVTAATGVGLTYQWYSNTANSNAGGTSLAAANGAQTNSYTPQSTTAGTLYYYCIVSGTCGPAVTSAVSGAYTTNANVAISSQSTATQTRCISVAFSPITVTATGLNLTYQWYSNTTASTTGGTSLAAANGAQTNSYKPQSTTAGTLYYYCIVSGNCGSPVTSAVSGAFITNANVAISSQSTATQARCIYDAFAPITVTATGATGYQWYSNTTASTTGGTSLAVANGAQTNSYTPQPSVAGTLYYYCIVSGACASPVTSVVSGAFTVNPQSTACGAFITRWNLATAGSGATQLSIGTATSGTVNYYWQEVSPGTATGSGSFSGSTLTINGLPTGATIRLGIYPTNFQRISISNGTDKSRLLDVEQWGSTVWTSMGNAFQGCKNLNIAATDLPNLSSCISLQQMFADCTTLNGPSNINSWNTAAITNMSFMFFGATSFNQNIGAWNTSAVTLMLVMFKDATSFNNGGSSSISNWNTSAVTNMSFMFNGASAFNQPIGSWNTAAVTNMNRMFELATTFNQNIGTWNTNAVTDMGVMFNGASAFNNGGSASINNWTTSAVTDMSIMFQDAVVFNQPIASWNTGAVTNMSYMFQGASKFNQNIGSWNTAAVTNMGAMFNFCTVFNNGGSASINNWNTAAVTKMNGMFARSAFNQPIGLWNTGAVTNMAAMFYSATAFNQNIGSWNTGLVTDMQAMFNSTPFNNGGSPSINNWNTGAVANMSTLFYLSPFNQPIGLWNTSAVTNMGYMFSDATAFNQNLGTWNLNANVDMTEMLYDSGMDCVNYGATLVGWNSNINCPTGRTLGANGRTYGPQATAARANLALATSSGGKGWTITGDTQVVGGTVSANQTIFSGTQPDNITLTGSFGAIQWQRSTDNINFTDIAGATSSILSGSQIGVLTANGFFRAVSGSCTSVFSDVVSVTVITTTKIKDAYCGTTLPIINSQLQAYAYPSAELYRYQVSKNGTVLGTYSVVKNNFDLLKIAGTEYGMTYSVKVAVRINNVWGAYGTSCSVTTPSIVSANSVPLTQIIASQCGTTLAAIGSPISSELVYAAEAYRFQLTNGATVTEIESPIYYFFLTNTAIGTYGTTFSVKTKAKIAGVWGNYGNACSITTPALTSSSVPTTQVRPSFCGTNLAALNTKIPAVIVYNAEGYRFEITNGGTVIVYDSALYNFRLSDAGIVATNGTTYVIRVAAKVNGVYGNYGVSCNVTTPGSPTNLRQIVENTEFSLVAYPNPSNSTFNLKVQGANEDAVSILVFDMMGRQIENKVVKAYEIENVSLGQNYSTGVYNVIVSQGMNTKTVRLVKQ